MRRWNDGTRWNSGARWPGKAPHQKQPMAIATTNISDLSPAQKEDKGANIITKSTNNPLVPGNAAPLAALVTAQADLHAANQAVMALRESLRQGILHRNAVEFVWDDKATLLCSFTESATGGNAEAIISAGFGVRAEPTPPQPLTAPENLKVETNGTPGVSKLSFALDGADSFLIQCSPDPITPTSWTQVMATTKTRVEVPGAEPGKLCWFRVAGVNALGQGPWSAVAPRPVM